MQVLTWLMNVYLQAGLAVGAMGITAVANTTTTFSTAVSEIVW